MTREQLRNRYEELQDLPVESPAEEKRRRGRQFEILLKDLLDLEKLEPRVRIRPPGEEIDGSFFHRDRFFLLEAKWTKDPEPASSLYSFKGKLDGKLQGTLGVFISIGGFAPDAPDALMKGKGLNMLLFDRSDFEACLQAKHSFCKVLDHKLRAAVEDGLAHAPYKAEVIQFTPGKPPPRRMQIFMIDDRMPEEYMQPGLTIVSKSQPQSNFFKAFQQAFKAIEFPNIVFEHFNTYGAANAAKLGNALSVAKPSGGPVLIECESEADVANALKAVENSEQQIFLIDLSFGPSDEEAKPKDYKAFLDLLSSSKGPSKTNPKSIIAFTKFPKATTSVGPETNIKQTALANESNERSSSDPAPNQP
jgi:hypothetical protein